MFAVATSQLDRGDHAVVVRTNYATNLETPRTIGADLDTVDLRWEDGWRLDVDEVASLLRPGTTRLISIRLIPYMLPVIKVIMVTLNVGAVL